jgi:transcriptional regulator with XRE-family HTH domain
LRLRAGLSQEELAERARLSPAAIGALERGQRRMPYPQTVRALAAALCLSPTEQAAFADAAQTPRTAAAEDEPAVAALRPPGLPRPLTSFVGREAELAEVGRLLEGAALVTLTGPGGIGKTRLALEVGGRARERYPDGVRLVELATVGEPGLVPGAVAAAVGVREQSVVPLRRTLPEVLGPRRLLLILDNCEHLVAACAELAEALLRACPGLRVLATSREPLGLPGEVVRAVPPLGYPDGSAVGTPDELLRHAAGRLFVERAAAAQPGFALDERSAPLVADIVRRLDGIPLAL